MDDNYELLDVSNLNPRKPLPKEEIKEPLEYDDDDEEEEYEDYEE